MSKYTTTIYDILLNIVPDSYTLTPDELVLQGVPMFFDFDFPWYTDTDEYKNEFKQMYLTYYLNMEIGQETLLLHKQCFKRVMYENVEKMRQKYDLLKSMNNVAGARVVEHAENVSETETSESKNTQNSSTTSQQEQQSIHSDNPQVTFSQNDYASDMDRGQSTATATGKSDGTGTANRTGNTQRNLTENETDTRNSDKYFKAINEGVYLINTDLLEKCRKLFMRVW